MREKFSASLFANVARHQRRRNSEILHANTFRVHHVSMFDFLIRSFVMRCCGDETCEMRELATFSVDLSIVSLLLLSSIETLSSITSRCSTVPQHSATPCERQTKRSKEKRRKKNRAETEIETETRTVDDQSWVGIGLGNTWIERWTIFFYLFLSTDYCLLSAEEGTKRKTSNKVF